MKLILKKIGLSASLLSGAMGVSAFAEGESAAPAAGGIGTYGTFIWLIVMVALFYFLLIRPQKKKEKADRQLRASLQPGDKVITIGGFTGRVLSVKDDEVTFETGASKTRLTVKKWAIQTREGANDGPVATEQPEEAASKEAE